MLGKLLEVIQKQNSESGDPSPSFDMEAFRRKAAQTLRSAFKSMDDSSKHEFLQWLTAVREIKATNGLSYQEKESRLHALGSSDTVLRTLKAVLDAAVEQAPAGNQQILRTSLSGIGISVSLMRLPQVPLALMLLRQALPKFLLTPQFDVVASFLEKELQEILKELKAPSSN